MNDDVIKRLKNIEGHVHGIGQMVENGTYCIDVIKQIYAVQASLDKVSGIILENHLHSCLITAVRGENPDEEGTSFNRDRGCFWNEEIFLINEGEKQ